MIIWLASVATPQFDGILHRLSGEMRLDIDVHYLHRGTRGRGWGALSLDYPHQFEDDHGTLAALSRGLRAAFRSEVTSAVVFGYSSAFAVGLLLACRLRSLSVFTQSDSDFYQHHRRSLGSRAFKQVALRLLYGRRTRVWAIGESNSKYWSSFGLRNQRHVSFESPVPVTGRLDVDIPKVRPRQVILYVGRIAPEKRVKDAIDAVQCLRRFGHPLILRLVGRLSSGGLEDSDLGKMEPWIEMAGPLPHDDLAAEYIAADVLVLPSVAEAYGLVVREALQFGLPVVATDIVPAAQELCNRGWNLVPVCSPVLLANALGRALQEGRWEPQSPRDNTSFYYDELRQYA